MTALLVGVVIGLVLGLTGAGGSLFAVPLLALLLGLPLVDATGVALGAVAVSAVLGVIQRRGVGIVWLPVSVVLLGGVSLAPVGRWLAGYISSALLMSGFSLLLLWVAWRMWQEAEKNAVDGGSTAELRARQTDADLRAKPTPLLVLGYWPTPILWKSMFAGALTGILSGLLGVGGGFVIVPILTLVVGLSMAQAVASSLLVISLVSVSGFLSHWWLHGGMPFDVLAWVSLGGILGMLLGGRLAAQVAGPVLQKTFAGLLLVMLAMMWLR